MTITVMQITVTARRNARLQRPRRCFAEHQRETRAAPRCSDGERIAIAAALKRCIDDRGEAGVDDRSGHLFHPLVRRLRGGRGIQSSSDFIAATRGSALNASRDSLVPADDFVQRQRIPKDSPSRASGRRQAVFRRFCSSPK